MVNSTKAFGWMPQATRKPPGNWAGWFPVMISVKAELGPHPLPCSGVSSSVTNSWNPFLCLRSLLPRPDCSSSLSPPHYPPGLSQSCSPNNCTRYFLNRIVWSLPFIFLSQSINSFLFFIFFPFTFISWRLITLQYCSGFCRTLTWISHGFTCVPHPHPPSHLPLHPIPLGLPSAPALSTCLMHPTWAGDLFHPW